LNNLDIRNKIEEVENASPLARMKKKAGGTAGSSPSGKELKRSNSKGGSGKPSLRLHKHGLESDDLSLQTPAIAEQSDSEDEITEN